jgi:hypothetical protein
MVVTDEGISININDLQLKRANSNMVVTDEGISIADNNEHLEKAHLPMVVTVASTITLVSLGGTSLPNRSPV